MTTSNAKVRIERDSMGPMEVPAGALYGASTMRAVLNFPISDLRFPRSFIQALGLIKLAAAKTNMALGLLEETTGNAVVAAAQEVANGQLDQHFVLDVFQTGSGTSTNTNANKALSQCPLHPLQAVGFARNRLAANHQGPLGPDALHFIGQAV